MTRSLFDDDAIAGWCGLHEKPLTLNQYEWKGCWTCWQHFEPDTDFKFLTVEEAAERYHVSCKAIYRWIHNGKLNARLFRMGRINLNVPKKFWAIQEDQTDEQYRGNKTHTGND